MILSVSDCDLTKQRALETSVFVGSAGSVGFVGWYVAFLRRAVKAGPPGLIIISIAAHQPLSMFHFLPISCSCFVVVALFFGRAHFFPLFSVLSLPFRAMDALDAITSRCTHRSKTISETF